MVKKSKNINLTPTQAINKNKKFDNAAYMLAIGDNTDNLEFLYPEELMPSVVTASKKENNYKQAEKEASTFRDRNLTGHIGAGLDQNLGDKSLQKIASTAIGAPLLMSNPATVALAEEMIVPALKHTGKVLLDPTKAYTGVGQALSTTADIYGTTIGLRDAGIGLNNIVQGNGTAQDYLNVGLGALGPLSTFNALRAAKFNPLLRYTANMYTPNIKKSIRGNKVVSDIPDGYSESGNPVMVGNQVYQKYIDSNGKIVYKYLGYPSQLEASNVQNTVRTVEDTLPDPPEEVFINTLDNTPNRNIVEDASLPDWVTQGNEPEIIPFRPSIDFSSARVPNSTRISTPNNRDIVSEIAEQIHINQVNEVLNNTANNIDEIDEIINTATRNHPHSSYFARKEFMTELANKGLMKKYLEKQLGKPIQDIIENYVYDGKKFITKEEASNKLRTLGHNDESIDIILNDSKDNLIDFLNGHNRNFDFPTTPFDEPSFNQATHNKRIQLAHLEDKRVINHLFEDNGALRLNGGKGQYIKNNYDFNDEDLELLEHLVNNYNKSANTNISVTDILNNEDIMADLRNYLRSNYDFYDTKGTEFPGDINHMAWFQAGNSSGYKTSSDYKQVANAVGKDVSDLIKSIPRGYALGETNTSFDSEMLKLLYSLRSNNYGRGKGQISVEFNKKPNGIRIDKGNSSHKERIFVKDLYDKYKDKLSKTDIEVLEEIINRGRKTKLDETDELIKKVSPELESIIKHEYDELGKTLSAKMQSVWDRLIQKDIELKDAPKIYPSEFTKYRLKDFISEGNITPHIHRPSIRIQKNKYGGKSKFKLGGMKENKVLKLNGGMAIPLDNKNKLFYLSGAKHEQGGIDITPELEAEGGEVVKLNPKSIKVVTAQKIMGGKSPAELVVDASPTGKLEKVFNKVFNYQEDFKDRYNLNDDGTKKAKWGIIEKIKNSNVGKQILDHLKFETFFNNEDYDSNIISINDRVTEGEYDLYPISKNSRYNKNNFYKKNDEIVYDSNGDSKSDYMQYKGYEPLNYDELRKMLPKRDYIGGSKRDVGIKVINKVPGLKDEILRLSEAYGISPNVFTQRLVNEGWVQDQAKFYNMASAKNQKNYRWDRMNDFVDGFNTLGLDTFGDHHKAGHLNLRRDIKYDDHFTTNEDDSGRVYNSADFDNMYDALEAKAAMLEYLTKLGKEKGHTGKDLDYWVNAAYNMGEYHKDLNNMDYVKKQYSFTPYYRFGGNMKKQYKLGGNTNLSFTKDKKKAKLGAADWVNISVNSAGALTNLITGLTSPDIRYARMKDPIPVTAPKINANVNITAEENAIDEEYYNDLKAINENTADSKVALNRIRNAGARRAASKVKIRSNAENIRRNLINKGNILAGEYQKYNIGRQDQVDAYNAQAEAAEFNANKDKVGDAISGFVGDLMQGTSTITNTLEKREADRNNAILTTLGYPEINPKTLDQTRRDLYKQMYLQDDIDRLKNRKTKIQNKSKWKEDRKNRVIGRIDKRINKLENF